MCKSYDLLRSMLASSVWLQRLVLMPEATYENLAAIASNDSRLSSDTTKERIVPEIFGDIDDVSEPFLPRPFVLARYDVENSLSRNSSSTYLRQDSFTIDIEFDVPEIYRKNDAGIALLAYYDAMNKAGEILSEWKTAGATASTTSIQIESWTRERLGRIDMKNSNNVWLWNAGFRATFQGMC